MSTRFQKIHVDAQDGDERIALEVSGDAFTIEGTFLGRLASRQDRLAGRIFTASATRVGAGRAFASAQSSCGPGGHGSAEGWVAGGGRPLGIKIRQPD